jgi:hypothetical protein
MRIEVEVPVRVRVIGVPDDAQLQELAARVRIRVAARLAEADEVLRRRHGVRRGGACEVREAYQESRDDAASYAIPSYDRHGQDVGIPVRGGAGAGHGRVAPRPWTVLRSVQFQTLVGLYLLYIADVEGRQWVADAALYSDIELETRWVGVWWVQVNRDYELEKLGRELTARAGELSRVGGHRVLAWAATPFDRHRERLAGLDEQGVVRAAIPSLHDRNAHRLQATPASDDAAAGGGGITVSHGGWVLYTFMTLPKIELTDVLTLGPTLRRDLPLRDAAFLVDADAFRAATAITWPRYAEEFPDDPVPLWAQAATVRRRLPRAAAILLLDRAAAARADTGGRPGVPGRQAVSSLFPLTSAQLARFPAQLRGTLDSWSDDATRRIDAPPEDHLEAGQRIAYVLGWIRLDPDRIGQAAYGPMARMLARRIVGMLERDPRDLSWRTAMGSVFWEASTPLTQRPPGGTLFEYVLAELERQGRLTAFFTAVDASADGHLRYQLMLLCLATRYADHPLAARLRQDLSARALTAGRHTMVAGGEGVGEIWLDHDPSRKVRVGQVFGDKNDVYITTKDLKRLKSAKAQALRDAIAAEERAMAHDLFAGLLHGEYDGEGFARQALAQALPKVGLTKDDFEKVSIQRSMRLRRVVLTTAGQLPQYRVEIEFVERIEGSAAQWLATGGSVEESADDFGARLIYWELGRAGEFYTTAAIAISVVGLALVAWEAGLVAILVDAAGGTTAVLVSIGVSELGYLYRVIRHQAELTLRGVLEAALDGYLMALSFRWAGGLGRWGARAIGTRTANRVVAGWFTERIIVGAVGGGTSAVLERFAHESIGAALGEGSLSGIGDYLRTLGLGAATGIVMEFTVAPVMHAALSRAGSAIGSAAEMAALVRREGWGALEWSAAVTEGLSNFRAALAGAVDDALAGGWARTLGDRLAAVSRELGANTLSRRVLELSGARFTRAGTAGLSRYLAATGSMSADRAVAAANALVRNPAEAVRFFEVLSTLDAAAARHLAAGTFASQAELAEFLGRLSPYSAAEQRGVLRLLGELGIEARTPAASGAEVLQRQFAAGLRIQAEALEAQAQQLQGEAAQRLQRAASAVGNPARATRITAEADRLARDAAALRERARLLREEAGAPSRQPQLPPVAPLPAGATRRILYIDHNVIDQVVRGNNDVAQTLLALRAAGVDLRISHWSWRELVLNPARVETRVHQRLIIEDLGIAVDDALSMARRVDDVLAATPPGGRTGFSPADTQVAVGARAGQGDLWSFDTAFRGNPANARARFGLQVAPESALPLVRGPQDYARARRLLGLDPIEIQADGSIARGRERLALPSAEEVDAALGGIEAGTLPPGAGAVYIRLSAQAAARDAEAVAATVRPVFRSRTGNRVVFRVEGGTDAAVRSHESLRVDASGNVTVLRAGRALNLNFGVFERASEFLIAHRRGARLVVFEVEEGWFQSLRSTATPERGQPAVPGGPAIGDVGGVPRTVDVRLGQDQLQIPDSLQAELQEFIVPGSGRVVEFTP